MEQLHSLVYVSSAVGPVSVKALDHLLERARERNVEYGVTGVLLFDAGNFMQYIEGPRDGLVEVYGHIRRDPLHTGIIELCAERPPFRCFGDWAMCVRVFNAPELAGAFIDDDGLEQRLREVPEFVSAAAALLRGFWNRGQPLDRSR